MQIIKVPKVLEVWSQKFFKKSCISWKSYKLKGRRLVWASTINQAIILKSIRGVPPPQHQIFIRSAKLRQILHFMYFHFARVLCSLYSCVGCYSLLLNNYSAYNDSCYSTSTVLIMICSCNSTTTMLIMIVVTQQQPTVHVIIMVVWTQKLIFL